MFDGECLKKLREEKGLTQEQLAKIFNVKDPTITRYEKGQRQPDTETLIKIAKFFNVSVDRLLGNCDDIGPFNEVVSAYSFLQDRYPSLKKDYNKSDAEGKKRFRQKWSKESKVSFIEDINNTEDKWGEVINQAEIYDITPEDLLDYINTVNRVRVKK